MIPQSVTTEELEAMEAQSEISPSGPITTEELEAIEGQSSTIPSGGSLTTEELEAMEAQPGPSAPPAPEGHVQGEYGKLISTDRLESLYAQPMMPDIKNTDIRFRPQGFDAQAMMKSAATKLPENFELPPPTETIGPTDFSTFKPDPIIPEDRLKGVKPKVTMEPASMQDKIMAAATRGMGDIEKLKNPVEYVKEGVSAIPHAGANLIAGFYKAASGTAMEADKIGEKLFKVFNKVFGVEKEYPKTPYRSLGEQWGQIAAELEAEGLDPGVVKQIYEGLGAAGWDLPQLVVFGLPAKGAISGLAEGGIPGAVVGGAEGALTHGAFKGISQLPGLAKHAAAGTFMAATTPGDIENKISSFVVGAGLMGVKGNEFRETARAYRDAIRSRDVTRAQREFERLARLYSEAKPEKATEEKPEIEAISPEKLIPPAGTPPEAPKPSVEAPAALANEAIPGQGEAIAPPPPIPLQGKAGGAKNEPNTPTPTRVMVSDVQADPRRFQYKLDATAEGGTDPKRKTPVWSETSAAVSPLLLWRDKNGVTWVVDGHHRLSWAKTNGVRTVNAHVLEEADGVTESDARFIGAMTNIRGQNGTATDAAKLFRERSMGLDDLKNEGVEMSNAKMKMGVDMKDLSDDVFRDVIDGLIPENYGAAIGRLTKDPVKQRFLAEKAKSGSVDNIHQMEIMAKAVDATPTVKTEGGAEGQMTLGGMEDFSSKESSIFDAKVKIVEALTKRLRHEKKIFGQLERDKERLESVGNVLAKEANATEVDRAKQVEFMVEKMAFARGPIGDDLNEAAKNFTTDRSPGAVSRAVDEVLRRWNEAPERLRLPDDAGVSGRTAERGFPEPGTTEPVGVREERGLFGNVVEEDAPRPKAPAPNQAKLFEGEPAPPRAPAAATPEPRPFDAGKYKTTADLPKPETQLGLDDEASGKLFEGEAPAGGRKAPAWVNAEIERIYPELTKKYHLSPESISLTTERILRNYDPSEMKAGGLIGYYLKTNAEEFGGKNPMRSEGISRTELRKDTLGRVNKETGKREQEAVFVKDREAAELALANAPGSEDPLETVARKDLHDKVKAALDKLVTGENRERDLDIANRVILNEAGETLDEIAKSHGMTRQRVDQIAGKAKDLLASEDLISNLIQERRSAKQKAEKEPMGGEIRPTPPKRGQPERRFEIPVAKAADEAQKKRLERAAANRKESDKSLKETLAESWKRRLADAGHELTRTYKDLPETARFFPLKQALNRIGKQWDVRHGQSLQEIEGIEAPLSEYEKNLFHELVIFENKKYDFENGIPDPDKLKPEDMALWEKELKAAIEENPESASRVMEARNLRLANYESLRRQLIKEAERGGFRDYSERFNNPYYFRQIVIDYNTIDRIRRGSKMSEPRPGFAMKREGSETKLYSTNYAEVEEAALTQIRYTIEKMKFLNDTQEKYDIWGDLKKRAKANDEDLWDPEVLKKYIPDSHEAYEVDKGNFFYIAETVPDKIAREAYEKGIAEIAGEDLKNALVVGRKRRPWIVPHEVADTLTNFGNVHDPGAFASAFMGATKLFRQSAISAPWSAMKYNFRNLPGDVDHVFAGEPKVFKKWATATDELVRVFYNHEPMSKNMAKWAMDFGGMESSLTAQETKELGLFRNALKKKWAQGVKSGLEDINVYKRVYDSLKKFGNVREASLRYAAYLESLADQKKNGKPTWFGAANPEKVMALDTPEQKAFAISNILLGAYDSVTVFGRSLRRSGIVPFWSWTEVNPQIYYGIIRNSISNPKALASLGRRALPGMAITSARMAIKVGSLVLRISALQSLAGVFNQLGSNKEEEKTISKFTRSTPHLNLNAPMDLLAKIPKGLSPSGDQAAADSAEGKTMKGLLAAAENTAGRFAPMFERKGNDYYFTRIGALSDILEYFGGIDSLHDLFFSGKNVKDFLVDSAKATGNLMVSKLSPLVKAPFEASMKKSLFPDVFNPRPIRDRGEYLAKQFGLDAEYRELAGLPSDPYKERVKRILVYESDPYEISYYDAMEGARKLRKQSPGYWSSNNQGLADAFYNLKKARRVGDKEAEKKYLALYSGLCAIENPRLRDDPEALEAFVSRKVRQSAIAANPLRFIPKDSLPDFYESLGPDGKDIVARAIRYYNDVVLGTQDLADLRINEDGEIE